MSRKQFCYKKKKNSSPLGNRTKLLVIESRQKKNFAPVLFNYGSRIVELLEKKNSQVIKEREDAD